MVLGIILAAAILITIFIFLFIYFSAHQKPVNNPSDFLKIKSVKTKKKICGCIGDSNTHGRVSCNYVDMLTRRMGDSVTFINAGVNSELAYNVLQRLDEIVKCNPDFITILIGSNDANASLSNRNCKRYIKNMKLPQEPSSHWYRENLNAICNELKSRTNAKIALLSLPSLGEDLDHQAFKRASDYSKIIKDTASEHGLAYLHLHENMTDYLKKHKHKPKIQYTEHYRIFMYIVLVFHYIFRVSYDRISSFCGFLLLIDLLHLNSRGAAMPADLIEDFIKKD